MTVVIKIGTSNITHATGHLNIRHMEELVKTISDLKNAGHRVVLVSSGAIAMGVGKLGLASRPEDMPTKQAAAAVGQCELMYIYDKLFSEYNPVVAQILLTGSDVADEKRRVNIENTLFRLLDMGALPIVNENDSVATEEIAVGDNDSLGAIVACAVGADLLVLLSDIDGLYTADPRRDPAARLIPVVETITPRIEALAGEAGADGRRRHGGAAPLRPLPVSLRHDRSDGACSGARLGGRLRRRHDYSNRQRLKTEAASGPSANSRSTKDKLGSKGSRSAKT